MRGIVIFLVLVNLVYFSWNLLKPEQEDGGVARQPEQPTAGNRLVLVSEIEVGALQESTNQTATSRQDGYDCFSIGKFPSEADAGQVMSLLASIDVESSLRVGMDVTLREFQVYLPPFSSQGIASITLEVVNESLAEAGVELQPALITSGELINGIEFARLESQNQAVALQEQLAGMAYRAEIGEVPVTEEVIEILVRASEEAQFAIEIWPRILIQRPYLSRVENLCETIAQGTQFP